MNEFDLALINPTIINRDGNIVTGLNIGITKNKIAYIGNNSIMASKIINCEGKYVTPSFANTHSHAPMSILRGLAEDVSIDSWFNDYMWMYESSMDEKDVYTGSKLGFYEMINNGITVSSEHYFMPESIVTAALDTGIKLDIAPTFFSGADSKDIIDNTVILSDKYSSSDSVKVSFGPHSTYLTNEEDLLNISKIAFDKNMKIHIHVGESQNQVDEHIEKYGLTPLKWLKKLGVLENKCILAHNLYHTEEDLSLLEDKHLISYCPKTYYKLAMGLSTLEFKRLNWSLGTDGSASNATLDIVEQAKILALFQKDRVLDATEAPLNEMWLKLFNAHDHLEFNTGTVEENYSADLVIWNLSLPNTMPTINPVASIIYSSNSSNIETVISGGKIVKENNIVLGFDEDFIEEVDKTIEQIREKGKKKSKYKF